MVPPDQIHKWASPTTDSINRWTRITACDLDCTNLVSDRCWTASNDSKRLHNRSMHAFHRLVSILSDAFAFRNLPTRLVTEKQEPEFSLQCTACSNIRSKTLIRSLYSRRKRDWIAQVKPVRLCNEGLVRPGQLPKMLSKPHGCPHSLKTADC